MNISKAVKKIAALGTGVTLLGATMFGAMAADLNQYPAPFVKDGKFNGIVVVGDNALAADTIGATDILVSLQKASVSKSSVAVGGSGTTVTVEGDAVKLESGSNPLNYNENIRGPLSSLTDSNLNSLTSGTIRNNRGTYNYNQFLDINPAGAARVLYKVDNDHSDDPNFYVEIPANDVVYRYRLTFPTALESVVDAQNLKDLENRKITLLGNEYTIISATETGTAGSDTPGDIKLELLTGAIQDILEEYSSKTYTLDGVDYEVELIGLSDTINPEVILRVNGEVTDKLVEGQTYKLNDGTEIGIKTVFRTDPSRQSPSFVEFYLGASKIILQETGNWGTPTGDTIEYMGNSVDAVSDFVGTRSTANVVRISEISVSWQTNDEINIPVGKTLSEQLESDKKGNLFLENVDFKFAGVEASAYETIRLVPNNQIMRLTASTKTGSEFTFDAMYETDGSSIGDANDIVLGRNDDRRIIGTAAVNDSVIVARNNRVWLSSDKYSHLIEVDRVEATKVRFRNVASGDTIEISVVDATTGGDWTTGTNASLILDGKTYTFKTDSSINSVRFEAPTGGGYALGTDYSFAGVAADDAIFYTKEEALVVLKPHLTTDTAAGNGTISIYEKKTSELNNVDYANGINITVTDSTGNDKVEVGAVAAAGGGGYTLHQFNWDSKDKWVTGVTPYGTMIEKDTDNEGRLTVKFPKDETTYAVFVTSGVTKVSESGAVEDGAVQTETINPIPVGSAKLASEVSNMNQNMIVVGGPCANGVAAQLMDRNAENCYEGFEEGKAMIKLYERGSNVAILVAGAQALDTRRASRVLANYKDYSTQLVGKEVEVVGTSTTFADTVIRSVE